MEANLNEFLVGRLPTVIYMPNFITQTEETHLLQKIYEAPLSKWKSLKNRRLQNWGGVVHEKGLLTQDLPPWLTMITQRISEESGLFPSAINHVLINEYLPDQGIMPHQDGPAYFPVVAILSLGSPVVMDFTPHSRLRTCTDTWKNKVDEQNFGREAKETETEQMDNPETSVVLMPRSLLIFKDNAYSDYLHGIKDSEVHHCDKVINEVKALAHDKLNEPSFGTESAAVQDVGNGDLNVIHRTAKRISLTCRLVLKVHKNIFKF
ncbi:PREDICTED: alpha-ketoglutarate-dependent dioxygenase alkB homolog 6 isoform X2 [Populus euphratica]|uniref:Alpha-ketoglutarate-dependent dioxygenase alkB homolog 6 isoform X2 n=1 Tax=Populus euphratica TaxID=75702 RepID=A0AAJ6TBV8_POPEU|nr:PREDICTED: alpha-ketoglutarate-dependent dioxygenase alkB homolog 6 isoform X2 [Populus euphratica]